MRLIDTNARLLITNISRRKELVSENAYLGLRIFTIILRLINMQKLYTRQISK
jgi:hypothetical protein